MKQIRHSRKINQFRNTARQINELIVTRDWQTMSDSSRRKLQWKLNNLFSVVRNIFHAQQLKKILAGAAFLIFIGSANAQTFAPAVTNPFGLVTQVEYVLPCFADLDNDGDLDILASTHYGAVKYFQNTGTAASPAFAAPQSNPFGLNSAITRPITVDLDNDGDLDIFSVEYYGVFKYYQNTGTPSSPTFALPTSNPFGLDSAEQMAFVSFADLDNDGDFDMLTNEYYGVFEYYENTGTAASPNFAAPVQNPFGFSVASQDQAFPALCDLDNDGDMDVLVGALDYIGNMFYFENSGTNASPNFAGGALTNPFGLTTAASLPSPSFGDLDDDGDMDIMAGDTLGHFVYFENTSANSIENITGNSISFSVSPNPARDYITINTGMSVRNFALKISEINGSIIYQTTSENSNTTFNTSGLSKGVYVVEISNGNAVSRKKLVIN
jgi:hypothetical protein